MQLNRVRQGAAPEPWPGTSHFFLKANLSALRSVWIGVSEDGTDNAPFPTWMTVADVVAAGWPRVYLGSSWDPDEESASASDIESPGADPDLRLFSESLDQALAIADVCCNTDVVTAAYALLQSHGSLDPDEPAPCGAEAIFKWLAVMQQSDLNLHYEMSFRLIPANADPLLIFTHHLVPAATLLTGTTQQVLSWPTDFVGLVDDDTVHTLVDNDAFADPNDVPVGTFDNGTIELTVIISEQGDPDVVRSQAVSVFRLPSTDCGQESSSSGSDSSGASSSGASSSGEDFPEPEPFGLLYEREEFSDTDDWTPVNGLVLTPGVGMGISNGGISLNKYAYLTDFKYVDMDLADILVEFTADVVDAIDSYGFGLSLLPEHSGSTLNYNGLIIWIDTLIGADLGKLVFTQNSNGSYTTIHTSAALSSLLPGDQLRMEISQVRNVFNYTITNVTTGNSVSNNFTFGMGAPVMPSVHSIGIASIGGAQTLTRFSVSTQFEKYLPSIVVGDSKFVGYFANSFATRLFGQMLAAGYQTGILAGGGETTADIINRCDEIIRFAPRTIILQVGTNDKGGGVLDATIEANINTINSILQAAGIIVINCRPQGQTAFSLGGLDTFIQSLPEPKIDFATGWNNGTMLDADTLHPNQLGNDFMFAQVQASPYVSMT